MKITKQPTFADSICDSRVRKIKSVYFKQMNDLLDWDAISSEINKHYVKRFNAVGAPSYDGLLLFKMCLLQTWYGLSDYEVEDRVNDSISFGYFCGLTIEQAAPDHSTVSRFRKALTEAKAYDPIFKRINAQLEEHEIIVKTGAIVDASVIDTPLRPKGKTNYKVTQDREDEVNVEKDYAKSVNQEASWLKKRGNPLIDRRVMLSLI